MRSWLFSITGGSLVLLALFAEPHAAFQQRPGATADGDWPMYRHDHAGTGASPLTQIDAGNVARLRQAWTYGLASDTPATGRGAAGPNSEATPIVVNGTDVFAWREPRRRARSSNGAGTLASCCDGRRSITSRRRVLAWRRHDAGSDSRGGRPAIGRAQCRDRRTRIAVRHERRSRPGRSVQLRSARLRKRRRSRCELAARRHWRHWQSACVRRANRGQAVGIQCSTAARRSRPRHVGRRQLEESAWRQCVAVLLHAR